jgi:hypothetical protein
MSLLKRIQEVQEEWDRGQEAESESAYVHTKKDERSPLIPSVVNPDGSPLTPNLVPSVWRDQLAGWPIEWRERWGRLANALEEQGVLFPESERRAFDRVKAELDGGSPKTVGSIPSLPDQCMH